MKISKMHERSTTEYWCLSQGSGVNLLVTFDKLQVTISLKYISLLAEFCKIGIRIVGLT